MARKPKSVYERIEEKKNEIKIAEENLLNLKEELSILELEKDDLEMKLLLQSMKEKGLNIEQALEKINSTK